MSVGFISLCKGVHQKKYLIILIIMWSLLGHRTERHHRRRDPLLWVSHAMVLSVQIRDECLHRRWVQRFKAVLRIQRGERVGLQVFGRQVWRRLLSEQVFARKRTQLCRHFFGVVCADSVAIFWAQMHLTWSDQGRLVFHIIFEL